MGDSVEGLGTLWSGRNLPIGKDRSPGLPGGRWDTDGEGVVGCVRDSYSWVGNSGTLRTPDRPTYWVSSTTRLQVRTESKHERTKKD